jgi:hypothetical protein
MDAIEHWPTEIMGYPPVHTIVSGDGGSRLHFIRRGDGAVQFFTQELSRIETDGQEFFVWNPGSLSGIYADLELAKSAAHREIRWLRPDD